MNTNPVFRDRSGRVLDVTTLATCRYREGEEQCLSPATWRAVWKGWRPDSQTRGCDDHIGRLLSPEHEHIVLLPLSVAQNQTGNVTITEETDGL